METLELFQRLGLALGIGFLVGVERGWKQRNEEDESRVAGLRTYTLIGLLGGIAGALIPLAGTAAFVALAVVFGLAWAAYKMWETYNDGDLSITGLVAGLLVFALGAFAVIGDVQVAAAGGVVVAGVMAFKQALHKWVQTVTWPEIRSAFLILAASLIAMPLLPDRALDPYGAFNPRELWKLTIVIASASFIGYVALRTLGTKAGLFIGAAIGAVVSSTVVTLDLARRAKAGEVPALQAAAAANLASAIMFARVGILIGVFAAPALPYAAPGVEPACLVALIAAGALAFFARKSDQGEGEAKLDSPLDIKSVAKFALLLAVVTMGARLAEHFFGDSGMIAFAATAGLVDIDAVSLAVGGMVRGGGDAFAGAEAILLAAAVNTLSKTAIALSAGNRAFAAAYGGASLTALALGAAGFFMASQLGLAGPA